MRKLEKTWIIGLICAALGVICAVVSAICKYNAAIAPCIIFAGIASYIAVGALFISCKRKSYGMY